MFTENDRELLEFVLSHPIGGGEDPPAGSGDGGTGEGGDSDGDKGKPASPAGGEGGKKEELATLTADEKGVFKDSEGRIFIPKDRLDEASTKAEELEARLEELENPPAKEPDKGRQLSEEEQALKADIARLFPGLENLGEFMGQMARDRESAAGVFVMNVEAKCRDFLAEVGIEPNTNNRVDLENIIGGRIEADPILKRRYLAGDAKVVDEMWPEVKKSFYPGKGKHKEDLTAADKKRRLPTSIKQGAPEGKRGEPEKPPETTQEATAALNKAHDDAWDRLNSQKQ